MRTAVGNSLTKRSIGPFEWLDRADVAEGRVVRLASAAVDPDLDVAAPVAPLDAAVCAAPALCALGVPTLAPARRALAVLARAAREPVRAPDALVPPTDGDADCEASPPAPLDVDVEPRLGA